MVLKAPEFFQTAGTKSHRINKMIFKIVFFIYANDYLQCLQTVSDSDRNHLKCPDKWTPQLKILHRINAISVYTKWFKLLPVRQPLQIAKAGNHKIAVRDTVYPTIINASFTFPNILDLAYKFIIFLPVTSLIFH